MISTRDIDDIIGAEAVDRDDDRIGKVGQVYLEQDSDQPVWVSVKSGLFGTSETLVPLSGAEWDSSALHLAFHKDQVKDAPRVEPDAELTPEEQQRLYDYYGMSGSGTGDTGIQDRRDPGPTGDDPVASDRDRYTAAGGGEGANGLDEGAGATGAQYAAGRDSAGSDADGAMTRSEERLDVGTEKVEAGRARLRKHVVTEHRSITVPVTHEEVRIEREPITDADAGAAVGGAGLSEEEHEVVLTEERPVVTKETVPVERVRLATEEVTDQQQVTADVRHEEIETDGDDAAGRTAR